jgi:hypothetical protein
MKMAKQISLLLLSLLLCGLFLVGCKNTGDITAMNTQTNDQGSGFWKGQHKITLVYNGDVIAVRPVKWGFSAGVLVAVPLNSAPQGKVELVNQDIRLLDNNKSIPITKWDIMDGRVTEISTDISGYYWIYKVGGLDARSVDYYIFSNAEIPAWGINDENKSEGK